MSELQSIRLTTKPQARILYRLYPSTLTEAPQQIVVFLNGLMLPQAGWAPAIAELQGMFPGGDLPPMITYDRFGQGQTTDRDPLDESAPDPSLGHDCASVVADLRQLLSQITREKLDIPHLDDVAVVFVANSIGCALARLYAQSYPGTVIGLLLLDSIIANSDFVSMFPDPDAADFDPGALPDGVTPENLREVRSLVRQIFYPSVPNAEGLDRRNLASLLPDSDAPELNGPNELKPFVRVVGHDFEKFVDECEKSGWPKPVTRTYTNPYWQRYNEGLVKITAPERAKGPVQAPHCGHFVQRDNPLFVAQEIKGLLDDISKTS
ncbi:hypothetical protein V2G26_004217 [Clonostachys chloroleuca]